MSWQFSAHTLYRTTRNRSKTLQHRWPITADSTLLCRRRGLLARRNLLITFYFWSTCASSFENNARESGHDNARHASSSSTSCAGPSVYGPGTGCRWSRPGTNVCDRLVSPVLGTALKPKNMPIVASCRITPLVDAIPAGRLGVPNISHSTAKNQLEYSMSIVTWVR